MSTGIEWTDETWNPIRARLKAVPSVVGWHCEHASPGCEHCYSETRNKSGRCNLGTKLPFKPGHRKDVEIFLDEATLLKPLRWRKPRMIFPCSMTDAFGDFVPEWMLDKMFAVAACSPQHTYQFLTKRSARMRRYMSAGLLRSRIAARISEIDPTFDFRGWQWPLPHVWLGVSAEDQQRWDERTDDLMETPAAVRWVSAEPLLGPIVGSAPADRTYRLLSNWYGPDGFDETGSQPTVTRMPGYFPRLDWVVCGGESGPGARPMHPDWARSLRDQCEAAGTAFFFKQWGEWVDCATHPRLGTHWISRDGKVRHAFEALPAPDDVCVVKLGKKRAGRLLDGATHDEMPERAA